MSNNKRDWDALPMSVKSELMKIYRKGGVYTLSDMKNHYNSMSDMTDGLASGEGYKYGGHMFYDGGKKEDDYKPVYGYTQIGKGYGVEIPDNNTVEDLRFTLPEVKVKELAEPQYYTNENKEKFYTNYVDSFLKARRINPSSNSPIARVLRIKAQEEYKNKYGEYGLPTQSILDRQKVSDKITADARMVRDYGLGPFGRFLDVSFKYAFGNDNTTSDHLSEYEDNNLDVDMIKNKLIELGKNPNDARKYYNNRINEGFGLRAAEDMKNLYLGLPQRNNTIQKAQYLPAMWDTSKKRPLYEYKDYNLNGTFANDLYEAGERLRTGNLITSFDDTRFKGKIGDERSLDKLGPSGKNMVTALPIVGQATVGYGKDDKGEYYSLYDDWDVNFGTKGGGSKLIENVLGGRPVYTYNRLYLDDYRNNHLE